MPKQRSLLERFSAVSVKSANVLGALAAVVVFVLMVHVIVDTLLRFATGSALSGTLEIVANWWMVILVWASLALADSRDEHIVAELVVARTLRRTQARWNVATQVLSIVFLGAVFWYGLDYALFQTQAGEYVGGAMIPVWPTRYLIPIGAVAHILVCIGNLERRRPPAADAEVAAGS